ncbi:hypothetical protein [Arthrobacter sp.]|uniref:hypothetical protein n=1 Tax=Arthrobacter sp. TaxID=1667 RepID=UPI003A93B2D0
MNRLLRSTLAAATALALATGLAPSAMADNGDDIPPEILSVDYPRTVVPGKTYTVTVTARDNTLWLRDFQLWNPGYAGMRMTNGTMTSAQLRPDGTWLMTWAYNADDVPYGLYSGHTIRVSDDNGNDTILPLEPVTVDDPAHPIDNTPTITGKPAVGATLTASIKAGAGAKTTFGWSSVKRGHSDGPTYLLDNWDYDQFSDRTVSLSSMTVFPDGVRRARHATSDVIGLGSLEPKTPTMATPVFTKPLAVGYQHPGDLFAYGGPVTTSVQWFRDGKMIAGATGDTFALKATDVGHRLRARVISATTSPYHAGTHHPVRS